MFFLPTFLLIFILFIVSLPVLFFLGYFHVVTLGFEKLGISPEITLILLLAILIGSGINIPLTRKKLIYVRESRFFGLWNVPKIEAQGIAINLGGAIIPILLSFYFLFLSWQTGIDLKPFWIGTFLMAIVAKSLSRIVPGRGVVLPALIPPVFSAIFAMVFAPQFPAFCAFFAGTLGVLIGADVLNLKKVQKYGGFLSIGGAGVFDGIFLVGIISSLLVGL